MFGSSAVLCTEQRAAVGVIAGGNARVRRSKFARLKTLNSCAMSSSRCVPRESEELRESKIHVGKTGAVDLRHFCVRRARRAEGVDRSQVEIAAAASRGDARRQVARVSVVVQVEVRSLGLNGRLDRKSPMTDTCASAGS